MFRAHDAERDRLVAVKVFRLDLTPEESATLVDALAQLVAARIDHPHIAAPVAAGTEGGVVYLAQEHAAGDSLDVVIRERGPMPVADAVPIVESLAAAIDHAAARGVHHGALHLRDVILGPDGVRMTGFGIAAALSQVGAKLPTRPQYASADGPSDVYALGAIAFEMVTTRRPLSDNVAQLGTAHGDRVRAAFELALAGNPAARPARASAFASALAGAAGATGAAGADSTDTDPLDQFVEIGAGGPTFDAPGDDDVEPQFPAAWTSPPPPPAWSVPASTPEPPPRRWPIAAAFLAFAVLTALSVGFLLRAPEPTPMTMPPAVDETTVDLPAEPPPDPSAAPRASTPPPARPSAPPATLPAATPSRPASGAVASADVPDVGRLLIRSTPAGADVFVEGRARGKTPLTLRGLPLGSYTIRVAREGYAAEERTLRLSAERPSASTTFSLRSARAPIASRPASGSGSLNVLSRPAGARVFVNDRLVGKTPLTIPRMPAGLATVRIELDGYRRWTTDVRVDAGRQTRVAASLER